MMFVPHRKHIYGPPWPVTGIPGHHVPLMPILGKMEPIQILELYLFEIYIHITLSASPLAPVWSPAFLISPVDVCMCVCVCVCVTRHNHQVYHLHHLHHIYFQRQNEISVSLLANFITSCKLLWTAH
jgi:hypothetical protein